MIPNIFVDCNDWGFPRGLMVEDENFNSPYSIDILLGTDMFFEVLCHVKRRGQEIIQFYRIQKKDGLFQAIYPQQHLK